jgi:hypothetical protein
MNINAEIIDAEIVNANGSNNDSISFEDENDGQILIVPLCSAEQNIDPWNIDIGIDEADALSIF